MTQLGRRAFTALGDLFRLPDNVNIGDLDLRVATPIFNLENVLLSSVGRWSRYVVTVAATAAANPNTQSAGLRNAAAWDSIVSTDGDGIVPDANDAILVTGAAVFVGTPANFTDAQLINLDTTNGFILPHAVWDAVNSDGVARLDGLGGLNGMQLFPFEIRGFGFSSRIQTNVTGNTDVTFVVDAISGPRGLFGSISAK